MTESKRRGHVGKPVEERRPLEAEGLEQEGHSGADAAERLAQDPEEQVNRTDQPDMTEEEQRPFRKE